jgi:hypothetical protein
MSLLLAAVVGISVSVAPYNDPLTRRPLDPKVVPLKCEALVLAPDAEHRRMIVGGAAVQLVAGEKKSTTHSTPGTRTELTCDVAPDGQRAKTAVTVYRNGELAAQQMSEVWLPGATR